jgi:AbrB family looped-hinge helix DNA binding protein
LVLPKRIREQLGLAAGAELRLELTGTKIILQPVRKDGGPAWEKWGGAFPGSAMLQDHVAEHRLEVNQDDKKSP